MRISFVSALLLTTAACTGDADVGKIKNTAPTITITNPTTGDNIAEGSTVQFTASVSDSTHDFDDLSVSWSAGNQEICPSSPVDTDGLSNCQASLTVGQENIVAKVTDPENAEGLDSIDLIITPDDPPSADISCPDPSNTECNQTVFYSDELVSFTGLISDPEDPASDLSYSWSSTLDGSLSLQDGQNNDGNLTGFAMLSPGEHGITLTVSDSSGQESSDTVTITVEPPLTFAPTVQINCPSNNGSCDQLVFYSDQLISFDGLISDVEDAAADLSYTWSSNLDGSLSLDDDQNNDGSVTGFGYLSEGEHGITLTATDSDGQEGSDTITINVGPPNSAPNCEITQPLNGAVYVVGDPIIFEASVSDADVAADWLTVNWSSDYDGALGTSTPTSAGEVTFVSSGLTSNIHVISMTVTDELGASCTDNVLVTIGTPPSIQIDSPSGNSQFNEGEPITFQATVNDADGQLNTLDLAWESSVDGLFNSDSPDSSGNAIFIDSSRSQGSHTLVVTVTDSAGLTATDTETFVVNGLPTAPTISIDPDPAYTDSGLSAIIDSGSSDPENHPITYSYQWLQNGANTAYTSATVPSSATAKGETWTVRVTPNDGYGDGQSGEASVTITNQVPSISGLTITPATGISTSTTLTCSATTSDADASDTLTETYSWTIDGNPAGSGATLTLTAGTASPNSVVVCQLDVSDGTDSVNASASVTVDNSDPVLSAVTITPASAYNDGTLTCAATASDPDGDPITYTYSWLNSTQNTTIGSSASLTLDHTLASATDELQCVATATDSNGAAASDSATITLDNRTPSIDSIAISPATGVVTGTTLTCIATDSDADMDSTTLTYEWSSGGNVLGTTSSLTLSTGLVAVGSDITCTATTDDGHGATNTSSTSVTLENSNPVISAVTITPATGVTNQTALTCSASASDPDGTAISMTYTWYNGATQIATGQSLGLTASTAARGDSIRCEVTVTDADGGAATDSVSVTVENAAPEITDASIAPDPAYTDDSLVATTISSDADGDAVSISYAWYVDSGAGAVQVGGNSTSLDGSQYFESGDSVYVITTPNDGIEDGAPVTSNTVVIGNTEPSAPIVEIQPTNPVEGEDDVLCVISTASTDPDAADTISYSAQWTQDGTAYNSATTTTFSGDTIPASATTRDEIWVCTVTPNDGSTDGAPGTASVTIEQDCDIDNDGVDAISCGGQDCDDNDPTIGDCFDGTGEWTSQDTLPDPVVYQTAMMDNDNNRALAYGGQQYYQLSEDLLEYEISTNTWSILSPSGVAPGPIRQAAASFDRNDLQWVMFGGQTYYSLSDELFVLDTTQGAEVWSSPAPLGAAPDPRLGHGMAIDEGNGVAYLYGGQGYYGLLDDVWTLDLNFSGGANWTELAPGGTAPQRVGAATVYDADHNVLYVIGGQSYYKLADTVACLDLNNMAWVEATLSGDSLPGMVYPAAVWSDFINGALVYGGQSYYQLLDSAYGLVATAACTLEVTQITPSGDLPDATIGGAMVYDENTGNHLLIGGQNYYQLSDQLNAFKP